MNNVENNAESTKKLGGITGKGLNPGQSGNPGGRPKGTLKDFVRQMFIDMDEKEKVAWLKAHKIAGIDMWKMGEGLPKADIEHSGEVTTKIVSIDE